MSVSSIKLLGGSVSPDLDWRYSPGQIEGWAETKFNGVLRQRRAGRIAETFKIREAEEFAVADSAVGIRVFGAAGWGTLGALVAGPVGAIVGGLLGGRGEFTTFLGKFGGATILGQVPKKIWLQMLADRY